MRDFVSFNRSRVTLSLEIKGLHRIKSERPNDKSFFIKEYKFEFKN
jgi:hypothetical protein